MKQLYRFVLIALAIPLLQCSASRDAGSGAPGTEIVFMSDRDGNDEIYVMNADGSGQTRLTNNEDMDVGPEFSADGLKIAFSSSLG